MDGDFTEADGSKIFLPPLHPRCRCCVVYEEDRLNRQEERAVIDYVGPNMSYILNEKLRNGEKLTKEEKDMRDNLDAALKHFPKFEGNLLRAVPFDDEGVMHTFLEGMNPGKYKVFLQYLSTSWATGYNDNAEVLIYIQNAKNGRNLIKYGKNEKEVLYARNSKFKILSKVLHNNQWVVLMEEAE